MRKKYWKSLKAQAGSHKFKIKIIVCDKMILITGGSGKLGRHLVEVFDNALVPVHNELDITNKDAVFDYIGKHKLEKIIHAAAIANVKECETDRKKAWEVNVNGTENLVEACLKFNPDVYFIYISTACVFDGKGGNYSENDVPYPENFYSLTKLLGEFVARKLKNHLIIRTNFVPKEKWRYPKAFQDRWGAYLWAHQVAKGIKEVVDNNLLGIVHVVGNKKLSMYELAKKTTEDVEPFTLKEYYSDPNNPKLTQDMTLISNRWKTYDIDSD